MALSGLLRPICPALARLLLASAGGTLRRAHAMTAPPPMPKTLPGPARLARSGYDGARAAADKTNGRAALAAPAAIPRAGSAAPSAFGNPPAPAPTQPASTAFANIQRPLASVWGVALLLNQSEEFVERLVEDGELAWVFNIAGRGSRKRCLRVFIRCVLDFRAHVKNDFSATFVFNAIFPEARPRFCTREVAYAWHCGAEQVRGLATQGALKMLPGGALRGANSRAWFSRANLADFLTSRRVI